MNKISQNMPNITNKNDNVNKAKRPDGLFSFYSLFTLNIYYICTFIIQMITKKHIYIFVN